MTHQPLPIPGYTPQNDNAVALVHGNKLCEEKLLRLLDQYERDDAIDKRWLATARSHFEQDFMAFNRAIFKPSRIRLPEDDDGA